MTAIVSARPGVLFEGLIVGELDRSQEPPLTIPTLIDCHPQPPAHNVFRRVEGSALSLDTILDFSGEEKYELGKKVGEFAAWMARAMDFSTYDQIMLDANHIKLSDRLTWLKSYVLTARGDHKLDENLAEMLLDLDEERKDLEAQGLLQPTMIGHDDIRPDNITFIERENAWHAHGIIDFGITQPSRPERELRHVANLGDEARQGAIAGYEGASGERINLQLLDFWARAQLIQTSAFVYLNCDRETLRQKQHILELMHPNIDWSTLVTSDPQTTASSR